MLHKLCTEDDLPVWFKVWPFYFTLLEYFRWFLYPRCSWLVLHFLRFGTSPLSSDWYFPTDLEPYPFCPKWVVYLSLMSVCYLKVSSLNFSGEKPFSGNPTWWWLRDWLEPIFSLDSLIFFLDPFFDKRLVDSSIFKWFAFYIFLKSSMPPMGL